MRSPDNPDTLLHQFFRLPHARDIQTGADETCTTSHRDRTDTDKLPTEQQSSGECEQFHVCRNSTGSTEQQPASGKVTDIKRAHEPICACGMHGRGAVGTDGQDNLPETVLISFKLCPESV